MNSILFYEWTLIKKNRINPGLFIVAILDGEAVDVLEAVWPGWFTNDKRHNLLTSHRGT